MTALIHAPEFYSLSTQYTILLDFKNRYPEIFYPNRKIYTVYGCFPNMIWNGGRAVMGNQICIGEAESLIDYYVNQLNIIPSFTMTNLLLEKSHCYDTFCNEIMNLAVKYDCPIMIANDILEAYLKKEYPTLKLIRSVCAASKTGIAYDISDRYFLSVLDRNYNNDENLINNIPVDKRNKIELLCNDRCHSFCSMYTAHHKHDCEIQLLKKPINSPITCIHPSEFPFYASTKSIGYISPTDIDKFINKGFKHFKIVGRDGFFSAISSLTQYLILPDYQEDMKNNLIGNLI